MAYSVVISSALPRTTKEDVERTFRGLDFGELHHIDMVDAQSRGNPVKKFFIHYTSTNANAAHFLARLDENDNRQKTDGEIVPPVRVIYNRTRDGRDQYWQVYKTKTPEERLAAQAVAAAAEPVFTPRIEM